MPSMKMAMEAENLMVLTQQMKLIMQMQGKYILTSNLDKEKNLAIFRRSFSNRILRKLRYECSIYLLYFFFFSIEKTNVQN